jgi:hypothetical protein
VSPKQINQELIKNYLQDTLIRVVVGNINSTTSAANYHIPVPARIPEKINIAVRAPANSQDCYWVAIVLSEKSEQPLVYNLRYYNYNKSKKNWVLMKGTSAYGWVSHSAVLVAGLEFNNDNSMKAGSVKHVTAALDAD